LTKLPILKIDKTPPWVLHADSKELIKIDFYPGIHGNFLDYSINALDPVVRLDDPFTKFGTSHKAFERTLSVCYHYTINDMTCKGRKIISLTAEQEDTPLVVYLNISRVGDYGYNVKDLNINFYSTHKKMPGSELYFALLKKCYNVDVKKTDSISRGILREFFKFGFLDYSTCQAWKEILRQKQVHLNSTVPVLEINFKKLYTFETYIETLTQIIQYFNLEYSVDLKYYQPLWLSFIKKIDAIRWNINAHNVFESIQKMEHRPIDFNLLQESWLNARLEIAYNKEMPFKQEQYFTNTKEIIKYLGLDSSEI